MKLIHLIAIALIIIIPMALLLTNYSNAQLKTLENQISYDQKLNSSTYDAVKAFQLNMSNSSTSNIVNSKIRDIEASINVFFNSISNIAIDIFLLFNINLNSISLIIFPIKKQIFILFF